MSELSIVAGGMATSLLDLRNGGAALRAGMVRQVENALVKNFEPDTGDIIPVTTNAVWNDILAGYGLRARMQRLLEWAFADLQRTSDLNLGEGTIGVILNLPSDYYQRMHEGEEFYEGSEAHSNLMQHVLKRFVQQMGVEVNDQHIIAVLGDGAGVCDVFEQAEALLSSGAIDRCLVGAVDSLIDAQLLDSLLEMGCIATPSDCSGFYPGEAAALFVVEKNIPSERALLSVGSFSVNQDGSDFDDRPASGEVLAKAIEQSLGEERAEKVSFALGANNGSSMRAYESSIALIASEQIDPEVRIWHVSETFGETGAVAGFLSLAVLLESFSRGYAPADSALIWQCSPDGRRVSFLAEKGGAKGFVVDQESAFPNLEPLYAEHIEEASFLYSQWTDLMPEDSMGWLELDAFCDQRLEAHLDALVVGGDLALEVCTRQSVEGDAGELFAAVSVFCRQGRRDLLDAVLEDLDWDDVERVQAVTDALCFELTDDWAEKVVTSLLAGDVNQLVMACRLIAFQRLPFAEPMAALLLHEDQSVQDAAQWSLAQCGERTALPAVKCSVVLDALCGNSIAVDIDSAESIFALGLQGLGDSISDLMDVLSDESLAESAALALNLITGANLKEEIFIPEDIQEEDLFEEELEAFREGTLYSEGEWPGETGERICLDPEVWQAWWNEHQEEFAEPGRYRNGKPFAKGVLVELLKAEDTPNQVRKWCGYELALQFEVDVPFDTMMRVTDQLAALEQI